MDPSICSAKLIPYLGGVCNPCLNCETARCSLCKGTVQPVRTWRTDRRDAMAEETRTSPENSHCSEVSPAKHTSSE